MHALHIQYPQSARRCAYHAYVNFDELASEWLRLMRGRRSQRAHSRRLGYSSNIAYRWETGVCYPLAREAFVIARRDGDAGRRALAAFHGGELPAELADIQLGTNEGIAQLLRYARGKTSLVELARRSGSSRFSIARWLSGATEPRLPELLSLLQAATFRLLDFLACFTNIEKLPSVAAEFRTLEAARKTAYEVPWSHAVLRALELTDYQRLARHRAGWLAKRLGITRQEEDECLSALALARQIELVGGSWRVARTQTLDTRADPTRARRLKGEWLKVAQDRLAAGGNGVFSYNLMSMSRADLQRLRDMHAAYFRNMQALVTDSAPSECVVLFNTQLLALDSDG